MLTLKNCFSVFVIILLTAINIHSCDSDPLSRRTESISKKIDNHLKTKVNTIKKNIDNHLKKCEQQKLQKEYEEKMVAHKEALAKSNQFIHVKAHKIAYYTDEKVKKREEKKIQKAIDKSQTKLAIDFITYMEIAKDQGLLEPYVSYFEKK